MHPDDTLERHWTVLQCGEMFFSYSTAAVLHSDYVNT